MKSEEQTTNTMSSWIDNFNQMFQQEMQISNIIQQHN